MKILLFGKNGQVGWELQRSLAPLGTLIAVDRTLANLDQPENLRQFIASVKPDWIVNAAAYTQVDKAETDIDLANTINAESVKVMAEEALRQNAWLVHYSTDYVFDGNNNTPYVESDGVNPLSVYGKSKLAGEIAIQQSGCKFIIFRTSWVFAAKGNNFAKSMLRLAKDRNELRIVADQHGAPTSAELIADISALCIQQITSRDVKYGQDRIGIYHLVASGETTWHEFAKYVITKAQELGGIFKVKANTILPISTSEYPLPAARPKNSTLNTDKLKQAFCVELPQWQIYVDRMLSELNIKE